MSDAPYWVSPREANLLITGRCNLRCRHCSVLSHGPLKEDLPLSDWERILDELARNKLIKLTLTGGEPLVREDFPEFLNAVAERPFRFSVNTNGTLITPGVIESLVKHRGRLNDVMVSLDGPDAETVDSQRGEGVFEKLILGVKKLRTAGLPFGFYCTVTSLNVDRLVETADLAMRTGAGWIKFNNMVIAGPSLVNSISADIPSMRHAAEQLEEINRRKPGYVTGSILWLRERAFLLKENKIVSRERGAFSCGGGKEKIAVLPDGTVTPCDHLPQLGLGNLLEMNLEKILTGDRMTGFSVFVNGDKNQYSDCSSCELIQFCTGGCPIEALLYGPGVAHRISCLKEWLV